MVLHKNKWDKKASRQHEKKLAQKDSKAAAEEKEKTAARAAARVASRTGNVSSVSAPSASAGTTSGTTATTAGTLDPTAWPAVAGEGSKPRVGAAAGETKTVAAGDDARETTSQSDGEGSEGEEGEEGQDGSRYSRRKKMASNSWRYDEPEPEPGAEPEDVEDEPDYVGITRDKFKAIEEREEAEKEEIIDIRDPNSNIRRGGQSADLDFAPKGNVVKANRDDFKDLNDKIAKQASVDRFRQRFATRKTTSGGSKEDGTTLATQEDELDALIGNMDIKGKTAIRSPIAPQHSGNMSSAEAKPVPRKKTTHLDDDWLDDMLR